jgi:hypothetical protein
MPNFNATYFFEGIQGGSGWTETFYFVDADISTALTDARAYVRPRLNILTADFALTEVRVSDLSVLRDSLVQSYPLASAVGALAGAPPPGDWGAADTLQPAWNGLLIRLEGTSLHRRSLILRGIPGGITDSGGHYTPTPGWNTAFLAWKNFLLRAPAFSLRLVQRGLQIFPTAVAIDPDARSLTLTLAGLAPAGWIPGANVICTRFQGASPVNGTWNISGVIPLVGPPATTTVLLRPKLRKIYGTALNTGIWQVLTYPLQAITNVIPERGVKKATGRPFDLPRGRARVKRG